MDRAAPSRADGGLRAHTLEETATFPKVLMAISAGLDSGAVVDGNWLRLIDLAGWTTVKEINIAAWLKGKVPNYWSALRTEATFIEDGLAIRIKPR